MYFSPTKLLPEGHHIRTLWSCCNYHIQETSLPNGLRKPQVCLEKGIMQLFEYQCRYFLLLTSFLLYTSLAKNERIPKIIVTIIEEMIGFQNVS